MAFPDVLPPLIAHLHTVHDVPVASRRPDPMPAEWIQVRRVGGPALVPVRDQPRLDVWAWSTSDHTAMTLALAVRGTVWALAGQTLGGVVVYAVSEFLGPRLDDDPIAGASGNARRVWATYELTIRADSAVRFAAP